MKMKKVFHLTEDLFFSLTEAQITQTNAFSLTESTDHT